MNFEKLFGIKKNKTNNTSNVILKSHINIDTKINEVFASTKVTQKIFNETKEPIEIEIFINKYLNKIIFSSFYAQVGNSLIAKSKVIKEEKAEEKYTDSISSGNVGIYTSIDKYDKNKIIVHIGNIPPKEELKFISEFIQFTESSNDFYEHELFRSLPKLVEKSGINCDNALISGSLELKLKNKITINKKFMSKELIVENEKYKQNNTQYCLEYKYSAKSLEYIQSNKIYFKSSDFSNPMNIFSQISSKNKKEKSYVLNYKLEEDKSKLDKNQQSKENLKLSPALFIFLLDQSGSMAGSPMKVASKALLLFLQSLPAGSYYQIIGFGSDYRLYDDKPKEYNEKNIQKSIEIVQALKGNMGGTNIYDPLKYIYNSGKDYDEILLPRNIFLLTDGEITNKKDTLNLIETNNNEYSVYSFGIGNSFDEDLIKNAGVIGKGSYSFCRDIKGLNQVIASTLNNICGSYTCDLKIDSSLDKLNLYKLNGTQKIVLQNKINRYYYIIEKEKLENKKLDFKMTYTQNNKNYIKNYTIEPIELIPGEELSKLIMHKYLTKEKDLSNEEKIKLALKYQLFIEGTSLFAEVENSVKITENIQHKEVQKSEKTKENIQHKEVEKQILIKNNKEKSTEVMIDQKIKDFEMQINNLESRTQQMNEEAKEKLKNGDMAGAERIIKKCIKLTEQIKQKEGTMAMLEEQKMMLENTSAMKDVMSAIKQGNCAIKQASKDMSVDDLECLKMDNEEIKDFFKEYENEDNDKELVSDIISHLKEEIEGTSSKPKEEKNKENIEEELDLNQFLDGDSYVPPLKEEKKVKEEKKKEEKKEKEETEKKEKEEENLKLNLDKKDDIMIIINSQNFIEGFWNINNKTKIIKKKYENEFKLLKEKNFDDIVAMTIIIVYFINKEHKELIEELVMILKKAKLYIQDKGGDSYENIIKKAGIV